MRLEIKKMATSMFVTLSLNISRTSWSMKVSDGSFFWNFHALSFEPNLCWIQNSPLTEDKSVDVFSWMRSTKALMLDNDVSGKLPIVIMKILRQFQCPCHLNQKLLAVHLSLYNRWLANPVDILSLTWVLRLSQRRITENLIWPTHSKDFVSRSRWLIRIR